MVSTHGGLPGKALHLLLFQVPEGSWSLSSEGLLDGIEVHGIGSLRGLRVFEVRFENLPPRLEDL